MPTASRSDGPVKVFISYAHKDELLRNELEIHLSALEREKKIALWHDRKITWGHPYEDVIVQHLNMAKVVLLLVSQYFIASDYCYGIEVGQAMKRHEDGEAIVIPVILRPCDWISTPLGKLPALPKNGLPVVKWSLQDDAFLDIVEGIREAVKKIADAQHQSAANDAPDIKLAPKIPEESSHSEKVVIKFDRPAGSFSKLQIIVLLQNEFGVNIEKINISILDGSVKVVIEGDSEELSRIVEAYKSSAQLQRKLARSTSLKSITYDGETVEARPLSLIDILREAIRAVPAGKYALGVAGIAAAVTLVAGVSVNYKLAILGPGIMFGLMLGLILSSWLVYDAAPARKPLSLTLARTFVLLIAATSFWIITGFFFSWPRPLEAYVGGTPGPQPSPTVIAHASPSPSPTPTITHGAIRITIVPPYDPVGGPDSREHIEGEVSGVDPDNFRVVIYAFTDRWYVQPLESAPFTTIKDDKWKADIQTGTKYAALLVKPEFNPPAKTSTLPKVGGDIVDIKIEQGKK